MVTSHRIWLSCFPLLAVLTVGLLARTGSSADNPGSALSKALTFHASFDKGTDADVAFGDKRMYTATSYQRREDAQPGLGNPDVSIVEGRGKFGAALQFRKKNTRAIYYRAEKNVAFASKDLGGTVSFWLSLDPNQDLEPGYCDPFQLTDKDYNDSAVWVDFTRDDHPRHFRLGVFGELRVWNPKNLGPDQSDDFNKRLVIVTQPPFARGQWTQVAVTFSGLNSEKGGTAKLYVNGRLQGASDGIHEPFTWDLARAAIRLGVNYVGLYDDVAIFNRALTENEIRTLHELKRGVAELR